MPGKFMLVECKNCGNKQIVFDRSSTVVRCKKCNEVLVTPSSGKAKINAKIVQIF